MSLVDAIEHRVKLILMEKGTGCTNQNQLSAMVGGEEGT